MQQCVIAYRPPPTLKHKKHISRIPISPLIKLLEIPPPQIDVSVFSQSLSALLSNALTQRLPLQSVNQSENFYSTAYSKMDSVAEQRYKMGMNWIVYLGFTLMPGTSALESSVSERKMRPILCRRLSAKRRETDRSRIPWLPRSG